METVEATFKVIKASKFYKDLFISITLEGAQSLPGKIK